MFNSLSYRRNSPRATASLAVCVCALTCGLLSNSRTSLADEAPAVPNEKFTGLEAGIKMLRAEVGQDRRDVVASAMLLTPSEGAVFWPLYDEYRAAQKKVADTRIRIISEFVANQNAMSEDEAAKLTQEALSYDKKKVEVKEDYVSKMSKVLSARTVARFFQIDSRLDVAVDAAIASKVPLVH